MKKLSKKMADLVPLTAFLYYDDCCCLIETARRMGVSTNSVNKILQSKEMKNHRKANPTQPLNMNSIPPRKTTRGRWL